MTLSLGFLKTSKKWDKNNSSLFNNEVFRFFKCMSSFAVSHRKSVDGKCHLSPLEQIFKTKTFEGAVRIEDIGAMALKEQVLFFHHFFFVYFCVYMPVSSSRMNLESLVYHTFKDLNLIWNPRFDNFQYWFYNYKYNYDEIIRILSPNLLMMMSRFDRPKKPPSIDTNFLDTNIDFKTLPQSMYGCGIVPADSFKEKIESITSYLQGVVGSLSFSPPINPEIVDYFLCILRERDPKLDVFDPRLEPIHFTVIENAGAQYLMSNDEMAELGPLQYSLIDVLLDSGVDENTAINFHDIAVKIYPGDKNQDIKMIERLKDIIKNINKIARKINSNVGKNALIRTKNGMLSFSYPVDRYLGFDEAKIIQEALKKPSPEYCNFKDLLQD